MTLERLGAENKKLHIDGTHSLQCQLENVQNLVLRLKSDSRWRDATLRAIYEAIRQPDPTIAPAMVTGPESMRDLTSQLSSLAIKVGITASDHMLLRSLHFNAIKTRETQIISAHAEILRWLLDSSSRSKLAVWLKTQNGIYWINGKAGSGKSTLMKYLAAHSQITELLKTWAGTQKIVTASVYFWHAGTVLQKSHEGLFRSLLFEILRKNSDLIQVVCASKLSAFRRFEQEIEFWTESELREAIGLLKGAIKMNARFCFFIDGLDEYDGHSDDIIDVLQSLCSLSDVKLCVSSRSWNEFIDAFGHDSDSQLALEDLTREDIRIYVKQILEKSPRFMTLEKNDLRSQDLVREVVDKARGVFLWVVLVTRSLLNGVRNGDRIRDLQRRLREFPETLEKYFNHIYFSIEETYREQTAQTFKFILTATEIQLRIPLILISFLDEEDLDAAVVNPCAKPLGEGEILNRKDVMRRRLIARCKGLVEIVGVEDPLGEKDSCSKLLDPVIVFMHRTAYDFLATKHMQNQISENLKPGFEAGTLICKAYVALLKAIDYSRGTAVRVLVCDLIRDLARYVGHLETKSGFIPIAVLDMARLFLKKQEKHISRPIESADFVFFKEIIHNGSHYITEVLKKESHQISPLVMLKLILYVIRRIRLHLNILCSDHPDGLSLAWEQIFKAITLCLKVDKTSSINSNAWAGVLKKLLQYGADRQYRVVIKEATSDIMGGAADSSEDPSTRSRSLSAQDIITDFWGEEKAREILSTWQDTQLVLQIVPRTTGSNASVPG